jgi:hypothetical protein
MIFDYKDRKRRHYPFSVELLGRLSPDLSKEEPFPCYEGPACWPAYVYAQRVKKTTSRLAGTWRTVASVYSFI